MSNESQLLIPLHVSYIKALGDVRSAIVYRDLSNENEQNKVDLAYHMTTHLRMNAIYWGLTALCIMGHKEVLDREEMIEFVMSCWDEEAGPLQSSG